MKKRIKLGVVCLARKTFDYLAAAELYANLLSKLSNLEQVDITAYNELIFEPSDAVAAGKLLYDSAVDGLVVISGTFHLGHLVLELKKAVDKPLLLWGLKELPYDGGKIRLNSVCGVNLDASNLVKSGYNDFTYIVGDEIDSDWIDAVRMIKALEDTRLGIIGSHAKGFYNLGVDELAIYRQFKSSVETYYLSDIIDSEIDGYEDYLIKIKDAFDLNNIDEAKVSKVAKLCAKFNNFMNKNSLTALAVRCWPEFALNYSISPCAAMSVLGSEGKILACEGDVDCALTMIAHSAAGAETPFMADLSEINTLEDYALMWHCGVAPYNLTDNKCVCSLDTYFAGGKGVTADFVLRSGDISIARLDSIKGDYRLFLEKGKSIGMDKLIKGTYAKVRMDNRIGDILNKLIYSGVAHHVSMVYGNFTRVFEIFSRIKGINIL